ncbi:tetratricopeptide repeat protein [bacterium]|nr:tetratricopeptide repeat protein [bacterium]
MLRIKTTILLCLLVFLIGGCADRDLSRISRAVGLLDSNKPHAAVNEMYAAIKSDPSRFDIYAISIDLLFKKERYHDAANIGDALLKRIKSGRLDRSLTDEELASTYVILAQVYQNVPDLQKAESAYEHALAISPDSPQLLNALGYFYADSGIKLNEALRLTKRAAALAPNDGNIIDSLGWSQYKLGQYAASINTLKRAVELQPDAAELRYHLGAAYNSVGKRDEALIELNKALVIDSNMTRAAKLIKKVQH